MEKQLLNQRIIVGLTEKVTIKSNSVSREVIAKIDTGATNSSIDSELASSLRMGPVKKTKLIKSASGNRIRPIVDVEVELAGKRMIVEFTIADRIHMKYPVLIGQNILKCGFLIDPLKK